MLERYAEDMTPKPPPELVCMDNAPRTILEEVAVVGDCIESGKHALLERCA